MGFINLIKEGAVGVLTISRPDALNALNAEVLNELEKIITELETDEKILAVVITGEGKAFVAGADIAAMADMTEAEAKAFAELGHRVFGRLSRARFVSIAAVNGFALGGGLELAQACDIRVASTKAKFGQPEVNLGVTPGFGGTQRLAKIIGLGNALYLLLTGEMIDAETALRMGLVSAVYEPDDLLPKAKELAGKVAQKGPLSLTKVKEAVREGLHLSTDEGCTIEARVFAECFASGEAREGMKAFLEKRTPKW